VGGPAQYLLTPRSEDELQQVVQACHASSIPLRVLGSGSNLLVRDEGVSGAVVRLNNPVFARVKVTGTQIEAGAGALLSHVVTESIRQGLAGLENLAGIPGTIGGAVFGNAGGKHGEIGTWIRAVTLLNQAGERLTVVPEDLDLSYRNSGLHDQIVLSARLELRTDDADEIVRRLRKIWISKKSSQPLSSQSAGCIFRNPRGLSAGELIDQAGLKGTRIGGAEVSDRHANFIITHAGATSADVQRLVDLIRSKVSEQFGVHLELEVRIW
jgi:UDP-N-acetylmuramate dehydrogenase